MSQRAARLSRIPAASRALPGRVVFARVFSARVAGARCSRALFSIRRRPVSQAPGRYDARHRSASPSRLPHSPRWARTQGCGADPGFRPRSATGGRRCKVRNGKYQHQARMAEFASIASWVRTLTVAPRSANHRWAAMGRDASSAAAARRPLQGRTWRILLPSGLRPRSARERRWAAMRRRSGSAAAAAEDRQALAYPSRRQPACHRSKMEGGGIAGQQAWPAGQQALAPAAGTGGPSSPRRWGARPGRPGRPGRPKDRFHFERESERGAPRPAPAGPADRAAIARHCGSVCVPCNGRDGFRQRACNGAPCPSRPVGGRRCLRAEYIYNNII